MIDTCPIPTPPTLAATMSTKKRLCDNCRGREARGPGTFVGVVSLGTFSTNHYGGWYHARELALRGGGWTPTSS